MFVNDYCGDRKEITDLRKALAQAKDFAGYEDGGMKYTSNGKTVRLQTYWQDLYEKLKRKSENDKVVKKAVRDREGASA